MTFDEYKEQPVSKKIVALELDIPVSGAVEAPDWLLNYEGGIWFIIMTPDPVLDINESTGVMTWIPNPDPDDGRDIGSVIVNAINYIKVSSLTELRLQDASFYYEISTTRLYIHFKDWSNPSGLYAIEKAKKGKTFGFCNKIDSVNGAYLNGWFEPRLISLPSISKKKDPLFFGISRYTGCEVSLINKDGFFDDYKNKSIYRQGARIKLGFDGLSYSDYRTLFSGQVESYEWDHDEFKLKLQDPRKFLTKKIPENPLTLNEYQYLDDNDIDQMKPICYGKARNAECICLNKVQASSYFYFLLMDTQFYQVTSVENVYVEGILLDPANWTLDAGAGTLRIAATHCAPEGDVKKVTADFTGAVITNSLEVIKDVLDKYASIAFITSNYNIDEWNLAQLSGRNVCLYLSKPKEISKIIEDCCIASDATIFVQNDGLFTARIYNDNRTPVKTIQGYEWLDKPRSSLDESEFLSSVIIGYDPDQAGNKYRQYINTDYENEIVSRYQGYQQKTFDTILSNKTDAAAKSEAIMKFSKQINEIIKRSTSIANIDLDLMDFIIAAPYSRYGAIEDFGIYEILGTTINLQSMKVELTERFTRDIEDEVPGMFWPSLFNAFLFNGCLFE